MESLSHVPNLVVCLLIFAMMRDWHKNLKSQGFYDFLDRGKEDLGDFIVYLASAYFCIFVSGAFALFLSDFMSSSENPLIFWISLLFILGWPFLVVLLENIEIPVLSIDSIVQAFKRTKKKISTKPRQKQTAIPKQNLQSRFLKISLSDPELPHKVLWKKYNEFLDSVDEWAYNNKWSVFAISGLTIFILLFIFYFNL